MVKVKPDPVLRQKAQRLLYFGRRSIETLRAHGWRSLYTKVQYRLRGHLAAALNASWRELYAREARGFVEWLDFSPEELARSQVSMAAHKGPIAIDSINWFLPHFDHAYYGGVYTILRFAAYLTKAHGVANSFVIISDISKPEAEHYAAEIGQAFPALRDASVVTVKSNDDMTKVRPSAASVASLWTTAYYVLKFNQTKRKFYFLQDFEPVFYPAGSTSAQTEATYAFGFYGLTNTITLARHYREDYGGRATHFVPNVDISVFNPGERVLGQTGERPYRVFFYGRPDHLRNGFELGAVAMYRLKQRLGRRVQIVCAGQQWNPAQYGLENVVENLGLLSIQATAELYRSCDAGLVMMFTRHPSYLPFELMASGCLVVSNHNIATSWLLKDGENCLLTPGSASCIADTLVRGLEDEVLRTRLVSNAVRMIREQYQDWEGQIEHTYAYMCDPESH